MDRAVAAAYAVARSICRRHAPDVFLATAFLPAAKRNAISAVVAFTGLIRQAIAGTACDGAPTASPAGDSCCGGGSSAADENLALLRQRLAEIYSGQLDLPLPEFRDADQQVLCAIADTVRRYQIPSEDFIEWAEGCRSDAKTLRYATWSSLERVCRQTGGVFGLIAGCVLGLTHSDAATRLVELGVAARLGRALGNVADDLRRGRLYLPLEDLVRFQVTQGELERPVEGSRVRELMGFEVARARELYRRGLEGVCWIAGDGSRMAASVIAVSIGQRLRAMERDGYSRAPRRVTTAARLRWLGSAWRLGRRKAGDPIPAGLR